MDPKDMPIWYDHRGIKQVYITQYDFAPLFREQQEQKKFIKYCSVFGYLLGNSLRSAESRLSFIKPLNPQTDAKR